MGKKKNTRKAGVSDAISAKKAGGVQKKINPFEIHTNREKFSVLNRQKTSDRGVPGVSRAKASKRRQETLGKELNQLHKTNQFKDRRMKKPHMSGDDLATLKFSKEMMNQYESNTSKRKSLFNLNDDDDVAPEEAVQPHMLTHKGHTLKEIEQFQDVLSDADEEDEADAILNAEFTNAAHFGGGGMEHEDGERRSRKEMIDDLIVETKKRKAEVAKEKDLVLNMTDKLDKDWKSLIPLMGKLTRTDEERIKPDNYDRTMREMIFEARGEPTDKLKSAEEVAKAEKERLERLERERVRRMTNPESGKPKHRSADDLDDEYFVQDEVPEDEPTGNDGEIAESEEELNCEKADSEDDEGSEKDESSEEEDNLDDLKSSSESEEEPEIIGKPKKKPVLSKEIIENINLPFTFEIPETYEEFTSIIQSRSVTDQNTIVERVLKCNDPKLDGTNKEKLIPFEAFLFQYINDLFDDDELTSDSINLSFQIFNVLVPHLFDMAQMDGIATANLIREILKEKQSDFQNIKEKKYPSLEVFIFFKLISHLFSTSDFKHGIVTPTFVFISQLLSRCKITTGQDIARGLFLVTMVLEFTAMSKRFLPASLVFLDGIIRLMCSKKNEKGRPILHPPFLKDSREILVLKTDKSKMKASNANLIMKSADLIQSKVPEFDHDDFKVRALNTTLLLINEQFDLLEENNAGYYFGTNLIANLKSINLKKYPENVKTNRDNLSKRIEALLEKTKLTHLRFKDMPVKQLKMLEPKFEEQFGDRRRQGKQTDKSALEAMKHKVKRELKGAMREIRRDNEFVAKMRLNKQRELDRERKEKVKRIFSEASMQQSELNALDRQNKRKKR